jgi:hypothetical protein
LVEAEHVGWVIGGLEGGEPVVCLLAVGFAYTVVAFVAEVVDVDTAVDVLPISERRAQLEPRWHATLADFSASELETAAAVIDRLRSFYDELLTESAARSTTRPGERRARTFV